MFSRVINWYKELNVAIKAAMWYTFCTFFQKGIGFITVPIYTRLMTKEQYGYVNVYNSWMSIAMVLVTLNLFLGPFSTGMTHFEKDRDRFTSSMLGLSATVTFGCMLVYLAVSDYVNPYLQMPTYLVVVMFLEIAFYAILTFWSARQRFEYRYISLVVVTIGMSILYPLVGICSVLYSEHKAEARLLSHAAIAIAVGLVLAISLFMKGKCYYDKKYWMFAFFFALPLIPHYLSTMILNQSDRIMIDWMVGKDAVGIYSVAYSAGQIIQAFTTALNQSFAPWILGKLKKKDYDGFTSMFNVLFTFVGLLILAVILFAPEIMKLMASEEYYEAVWVIAPVAASVYFVFIFSIFANFEFFFLKNKFIMVASVIGALLNVALNYVAIPVFGYLAAGYTTLICYIVFGLVHYLFMQTICKKEIGYTVVKGKFILLFSVFILIASLVTMSLFNLPIIRYTLALGILLLALIKRNFIFNQLKIIRYDK